VCNCVRPAETKAHSALGSAMYDIAQTSASKYMGVFKVADYAASRLLKAEADKFFNRNGWYMLLPTSWMENPHFQRAMMFVNHQNLIKHYCKQTLKNIGYGFLTFLMTAYLCGGEFTELPLLFLMFTMTYTMMRQMYIGRLAKNAFVNEMIETNQSIELISIEERDKISKNLLAASAMALAAYSLVKFCRTCKQSLSIVNTPTDDISPQGLLTPTTKEEVVARDNQSNQWAKTVIQSLPRNMVTATMTIDQIMKNVEPNLYHCRFPEHDTFIDAMFVRTNLCIVPNHVFEQGDTKLDNIKCVFHHANPEASGGKFKYTISRCSSYHVPNTDVRFVYVGAGGDQKDITKYFPEIPLAHGKSFHGKIQFRKADGKMMTGNIRPEVKDVGHMHCTSFKGGSYSAKTFMGLCGAPIFSDTTVKQIVGVHLGGVSELQYGIYGEITQSQIKEAVDYLSKVPGVLFSGCSGTFNNHILGKDILVSAHCPEPKSPMNFLPQDSQFIYFGQSTGKTTPRSDVRPTPISPYVEEVMHVGNKWGKPKMRPEWHPYQTCMANMANPGSNFEHEALKWAVEDYTEPMHALFDDDMWKCQPLTHEQVLNGIDGVKFIDSMDFTTSIGYPLTGPKEKHTEEYVDEKGNTRREFTQEILDHLKEVEEVYKRGERYYSVCKACTKDEALPKAKEKCRIFYANPISLVYFVRKYFLPIARVMMMNPITSECAVGINSHGPEWEELEEFRKKFPNIFGGDYSKYDQNIPSQLVNAAFSILINYAERAGYDEESLTIMRAVAADVVYAMISFNGDLTMLTTGSMISGNSLTVIINGIVGSLNLRIAYYHNVIKPRRKGGLKSMFLKKLGSEAFREHVSLTTYGDDNDGSVDDIVKDGFNIQAVSEFLGEYGQKYTMPDKETKIRPFLTLEESDFLCRKTVYIPEINAKVGALSDNSIFKSLHAHTYGKKEVLTREEKVCAAASSAMIEWFNHGRDVYETRRSQLKEVMNKAQLTAYCDFLDYTFDDRVENWKKTYRPART
jgi:hypothetical protein